jgi:hypothetical protein
VSAPAADVALVPPFAIGTGELTVAIVPRPDTEPGVILGDGPFSADTQAAMIKRKMSIKRFIATP